MLLTWAIATLFCFSAILLYTWDDYLAPRAATLLQHYNTSRQWWVYRWRIATLSRERLNALYVAYYSSLIDEPANATYYTIQFDREISNIRAHSVLSPSYVADLQQRSITEVITGISNAILPVLILAHYNQKATA